MVEFTYGYQAIIDREGGDEELYQVAGLNIKN